LREGFEDSRNPSPFPLLRGARVSCWLPLPKGERIKVRGRRKSEIFF